jgi:hypothetical protein
MENEQVFEQMVQLLGELVTAAGPEWTMQFLQAGLEEVAQGGQEQPQPEMMSQGGPQSMGPMSGLGGGSRPMPPVRN